jgi:transcriptional regulator with XRE-family HTH domain
LRRVEQHISQAELGDQLSVSFQQVQKYEKGVNRVGAARLQQIATALDVPVTFFYDGNGKAREVESLLFLDSSFSLRLLRAYAGIKVCGTKKKGPVFAGPFPIISAVGSWSEPGRCVDGRSENAALQRPRALGPWRGRPCRGVPRRTGVPWLRSRGALQPCCVRLLPWSFPFLFAPSWRLKQADYEWFLPNACKSARRLLPGRKRVKVSG